MKVQATETAERWRIVFEDYETLILATHFVRNCYDAQRYAPEVTEGLSAMLEALKKATLNHKGQHVATMEESHAENARFALITHYYDGRKFYNEAMKKAAEAIFQ